MLNGRSCLSVFLHVFLFDVDAVVGARVVQLGTFHALPPTPLSDEHDAFVADVNAAGGGQQFFDSCALALTGVYDVVIDAFCAVGTMFSLPSRAWHALSDLHRLLHGWRRVLGDTNSFFPASFALQFLLRLGLRPLIRGRAVPWRSFAPLVLARVLSLRGLRRRLLLYVLPRRSSTSLFTQVVETIVAASDEECPWPVYSAAPLFITMFVDLHLFSPRTIKCFVDVCGPYAGALEEMTSWEAKALLYYYRQAHQMSESMSRMVAHWLQLRSLTEHKLLREGKRQAIFMFNDDFSRMDAFHPLAPMRHMPDGHVAQVLFTGSFGKPQTSDFKVVLKLKTSPQNRSDVVAVERAANACSACGRANVSLVACGGCSVVQYCSKRCLAGHWFVVHHAQCQLFQALLVDL